MSLSRSGAHAFNESRYQSMPLERSFPRFPPIVSLKRRKSSNSCPSVRGFS
jgi:hypothetical protein